MTQDKTQEQGEHNRLVAQRKEKLAAWRESGQAFPNHFRPDALAGELQRDHADDDAEALQAADKVVAVAGRLLAKRVMGKLSFATLQDRSGRIQLFVQRDLLGEDAYRAFKKFDVGDIVAARGALGRTNKGELSVRATELPLLTKSL